MKGPNVSNRQTDICNHEVENKILRALTQKLGCSYKAKELSNENSKGKLFIWLQFEANSVQEDISGGWIYYPPKNISQSVKPN